MGDLTWVPLIAETYWQIGMDEVRVGNQAISGSVAGIVNTGTSLIVGPTESVNKVNVCLITYGKLYYRFMDPLLMIRINPHLPPYPTPPPTIPAATYSGNPFTRRRKFIL
ncbi:unnamed protein product [Anisakis simplex]|uniref:Peptidase A1 domain-containing protein n=1 Tax=Anisakis simplex TaxID=6269 RepID=A0A0M3K202_ANISI|nr:unnamed protein product [Anisakis simplex]